MQIGSKVYWRKASGEVIFITPEIESEYAKETTKEDDMGFYPQLKGFDPVQVEVLQLTFRQYFEDFQRAKSYIVNPDTGEMEFIYVDTGETKPEHQAPLSDQVSELRARQDSTEAAMLALMDVTTKS